MPTWRNLAKPAKIFFEISSNSPTVCQIVMSSQKKNAEKITQKGSDYVIGLKGNQQSLYQDTEDYFSSFSSEMPVFRTSEKGHGRIEIREYQLLTELSWLEQRAEWSGLNSLGEVYSIATEKGENYEYIRYFITSLTELCEFAYAVRKHWAIENQLHWCLDVIFREDASRARKDHSPLNLNMLRKTALSLVGQAKYGRLSKKRMMFKAAFDPNVLLKILFPMKK